MLALIPSGLSVLLRVQLASPQLGSGAADCLGGVRVRTHCPGPRITAHVVRPGHLCFALVPR